jgi:histidine kinase 2/3/4 (cytokinin receptor)
MKSLIDNTLDFAKIESGCLHIQRGSNSLVNIMKDTVFAMTSFAYTPEKNIEIKLDVSSFSGIDYCFFDQGKLQQVVSNLLSNAIKFSPNGSGMVNVVLTELVDGDVISIKDVHWHDSSDESQDKDRSGIRFNDNEFTLPEFELTEADKTELQLKGYQFNIINNSDNIRHRTVMLSVRDSGCGIQESDFSNIFQGHQQLNAGLSIRHSGSDLRLAICCGILSLHNGRLGVRSVAKGGSEFIVVLRLPIVEHLNLLKDLKYLKHFKESVDSLKSVKFVRYVKPFQSCKIFEGFKRFKRLKRFEIIKIINIFETK